MSREEDKAVSSGGSAILRHSEQSDWSAPQGEESIEQISAHIERHLGKADSVYHEILSDTVHVDVHIVKPTPEFPFVRLVTSGMSDLRMQIPENTDVPAYAELMITLPGDWKLDDASLENEEWYWPVRVLKFLARLPHKYGTWLGWGHTIPNGDPAQPFAANTKLTGVIILPSITVPEEFHTLEISPEKSIQFFAVVPLYPEEMQYKLRSGSEKLLNKLGKARISDIVDPARPNVAKKLFGIF